MGIDTCHFYMIGDNPEVDIKGANDSGFLSMLVRTGVFQGGLNNNDPNHPAKFVAKDSKDAVDLICSMEGI
jgi:ribonucleotide monophosphatase NagD (HAD superfamily)